MDFVVVKFVTLLILIDFRDNVSVDVFSGIMPVWMYFRANAYTNVFSGIIPVWIFFQG